MITSLQLKYGSYKLLLPEIYALQDILEQTDWHQEDVFIHTLSVLEIIERQVPRWSELQEKIENQTRGDLLKLTAVLHDIGKTETFIREGKRTRCDNHEAIGADLISSKNLLYPFSLSKNEEERVLNLIRFHGDIHPLLKKSDWKEKYSELVKRVPSLEITLLGLADTQASLLAQTRPEEYNLRMKRYYELLGERMYRLA